jgi:hypothetical protein
VPSSKNKAEAVTTGIDFKGARQSVSKGAS